MEENLDVIISNHASMRYAERIADKDGLNDINVYVQRNLEKIENDINIMLDHSEHIYHGRIGQKEKDAIDVYLSGTWIILVDMSRRKVITLYKVDFRLGEEFNKEFISRVLERMAEHKRTLDAKREEISELRNTYLEIVKDNESQIVEYRTAINNLKKINTDYKEIVEKMDAECGLAELAVKQDVETLMRKFD